MCSIHLAGLLAMQGPLDGVVRVSKISLHGATSLSLLETDNTNGPTGTSTRYLPYSHHRPDASHGTSWPVRTVDVLGPYLAVERCGEQLRIAGLRA